MRVSKQATITDDTAHGRELWCGLGRCGRCSCPSFQGRGNICEYCGHHYDDHGTSPFRASEEQRRYGWHLGVCNSPRGHGQGTSRMVAA
jgi:hypothetical protein